MEKIRTLIDFLNENTKYYDEGKPRITDKQWDESYFELVNLERETGIIYPDSPTQSIFYENVNKLNKKEHNHKMLSLEKTKNIEDVVSFFNQKQFVAMCKMDGLTCSLTYKDGQLISAETRGNGIVGEDIIHNARVIPSIPKQIPWTDELIIDGEIISTYKNFERFDNEYKNPRNFASGSIRLLNADECNKRGLTFIAWDCITSIKKDGKELSMVEKLEHLHLLGFTVVPWVILINMKFNTLSIIEEMINGLKEDAKILSYPIDGIVFKFNDCEYGAQLAEKQKAKYTYGVLERQFRNMFDKAAKADGITGEVLLQNLESRLDNVVFRLGIAPTRAAARQLVGHKHIVVNGKVVNIPSYAVKAGDVVGVREKAKSLEVIEAALAGFNHSKYPWIEWDENTKSGKYLHKPDRADIPENIKEQLIVELYSKQ